MAQRLVRRLCDHCKKESPVPEHLSHLLYNDQKKRRYFSAVGCVHCFNTGYKGRLGIFEYLSVTNAMADALRNGNLSQFTQLAREHRDYKPLKQSAMQFAISGQTSLEEVQRFSFHINDVGA